MFPDEQDQQHVENGFNNSQQQPGPQGFPSSPQVAQEPQASNNDFPAPAQHNAQQTSTSPNRIDIGSSGSNKKRNIIIAVAGGGFLLLMIIVVVVVVVSTSSKTDQQAKTKSQQNTSDVKGPPPATDDSVQASNSAISQELSNLNAKDFPSDRLSDKNLGLN